MADTEITIGADTSEFSAPVKAAQTAVEALMAPITGLESLLNDFKDAMTTAFDDVKAAVESVGADIEKIGATMASSLIAAAKGGGDFAGSVAKIIGLVGGGGIAAAFTAVTGILSYANKEMSDLVAHAEQYGVSITRLQQLSYAASLTGVGSDKLNEGLQKSVDALDEMSRKENDFSKLLDANGIKWKENGKVILDTNAALLITADLVKNAANYSQAVKIAEWAGYSREAVPFLRQGAAAIQDMAKAAPVVSEELARQRADFAREWQNTLAQWEGWFKAAVINITPYLDLLVKMAVKFAEFVGVSAKQLATALYNMDPAVKKAASSAATFGERWGQAFKEASQGADTFTGEFRKAAQAALAFGAAKTPTKLIPDDDKDKKAERDKTLAAMEGAQERIRVAEEEYQQKIMLLEGQVKRHQLSEDQMTKLSMRALSLRLEAQRKIVQEEEKIAGLSKAQHQRVLNEEEQLDRKYVADRTKILEQGLEKDTQQWNSMLSTLTGAFNSQLRGLLAGTTTWSKAMLNIVGDLVIKVIEQLEKIAIEKAAVGLAGSFGGIGSALGGLGAILALDEGMWNVPSTQLALLHPGEMVMPASPAQQFRSNVGQGGGAGTGGPQLSMSFSSFDNTGLQAMLNRIMPQLARGLNNYQQLNPSTQ